MLSNPQTLAEEIHENSSAIILKETVEAHKQLLSYFAILPKDLKKYTQTFYKSVLPQKTCPECGLKCYVLENGCGGTQRCLPCDLFEN